MIDIDFFHPRSRTAHQQEYRSLATCDCDLNNGIAALRSLYASCLGLALKPEHLLVLHRHRNLGYAIKHWYQDEGEPEFHQSCIVQSI